MVRDRPEKYSLIWSGLIEAWSSLKQWHVNWLSSMYNQKILSPFWRAFRKPSDFLSVQWAFGTDKISGLVHAGIELFCLSETELNSSHHSQSVPTLHILIDLYIYKIIQLQQFLIWKELKYLSTGDRQQIHTTDTMQLFKNKTTSEALCLQMRKNLQYILSEK